jgi:hypothetical protein
MRESVEMQFVETVAGSEEVGKWELWLAETHCSIKFFTNISFMMKFVFSNFPLSCHTPDLIKKAQNKFAEQ